LVVVRDAIKKRGHFQDYREAQGLYVAQREAAKQAKADLALQSAKVPKNPRSLPRRPRKPRLQPRHLTKKCKLLS
jgi:hypothetical protein